MEDVIVRADHGMAIVITPEDDGTITLSIAGFVPEMNKHPYQRIVVPFTDAEADDLRRGLMQAQVAAQRAARPEEASCPCGATGDPQSIAEHIESRVCPEGGVLPWNPDW